MLAIRSQNHLIIQHTLCSFWVRKRRAECKKGYILLGAKFLSQQKNQTATQKDMISCLLLYFIVLSVTSLSCNVVSLIDFH